MSSTFFDYFRKATLLILTPQCFDKYFLDFNFLDGPCFSATLSKLLGILIIIGSLTVKVPQVLKIYNNKSGKGISLISTTLDLCAVAIYMSYSFVKGFPFTAWGDASFLAIQTVLIGFLVLAYDEKPTQGVAYLIGYATLCYILMSGITSINVLSSLQTFNIFLSVSGKLMQAWTNYNNGNTGQLSAISLVMLFGGSLARIFTSIQETGDTIVILTYIAVSVANSILVIQLWWYWNVDVKEKQQ